MNPREKVADWLGLGLQPHELSAIQVCWRSLVIFVATLIIVRSAHKRFLARISAFDAVLGFILASLMARAINGSAPLVPTLAAGLFLALVHRGMASLAFACPRFRTWVEGRADVLAANGELMPEALRKHRISEEDLMEEVRLHGRVDELTEVQQATLERSGQISVIPFS